MNSSKPSLVGRREFIACVGIAGAAISAISGTSGCAKEPPEKTEGIVLPPLPYAQNALAPHISENTISFHYGKHHQAYVNNTKKMIAGTEFENASLLEIIKKTAGNPGHAALFNNAAQVFNHTFYWNSMKPGGGGEPGGKIAEKIKRSFGGYAEFADAFTRAAAGQFGSGWAWLVQEGDSLKIIPTANADTPVAGTMNPLVTIDVWEHAYYLDYQNRRADYIKDFLDSLLNWDFAEKNLV